MSGLDLGAFAKKSGLPLCEDLVARDDELEILVGSVTQAPSFMLIQGEAGVGKTRLVQQLHRDERTSDLLFMVGHCYPVAEPFPLGAVVEALRSAAPTLRRHSRSFTGVVGSVTTLLPEFQDFLPPRPTPAEDPAAEKHRVYRGLVEMLAAPGRALLVLEDLHWSDEVTREFISYLVDNCPPRLSVVATYRTVGRDALSDLFPEISSRGSKCSCDRLTVSALEPEGVGRLVSELLGADSVSLQFSEYLHERTGGVPFAVQEVLAYLQDTEAIIQRNGAWVRRTLDQMPVPPTVAAATVERFNRLPGQTKQLVEAAAVIDVPTDESGLSAVSAIEGDELIEALTNALASGLLEDFGSRGIGLRHALAAKAIHDCIPSPQRRRLHLRTAAYLVALDDPDDYARLSHHYRLGGDVEAAARTACVAADVAFAAFNHSVAYSILSDALDLNDLTATVRKEIALRLGKAAIDSLDHREAIGVLEKILERDNLESSTRGELRFDLAGLLYQDGRFEEGCKADLAALQDLDERPDLALRITISQASMSYDASAERSRLWLARADALAPRVEHPLARLAYLGDKASLLITLGDPSLSAAVEALPSSLEDPYEIRELARVMTNVTNNLHRSGHLEAATASLARAVRLSESIGYDRFRSALEVVRANLDWLHGRTGDLDQRLTELVATAEIDHVKADAQVALARVLFARGRRDEAEELIARVLDRRSALDMGTLGAAVEVFGSMKLAKNDPSAVAEACEWLLQTLERTARWGHAGNVVPVAVQALLDLGRWSDADVLTRRYALATRGKVIPAALPARYYSAGLVAEANGEHTLAARRFLRAWRFWDAIPNRYYGLKAKEGRARCSSESLAQRLFAEALAGYEELGAEADASRLRQTLRRRGMKVPRPLSSGRRSYGEHLSPREQAVVDLARTGATNAEIAADLYLSVRTVENHLYRAMRKLDVPSKRALVRTGGGGGGGVDLE